MELLREVFIFLISVALATPIAILAAAASANSGPSPVRRFLQILVALVATLFRLSRFGRAAERTYTKGETFLTVWFVVFFISVLVLIKHLPERWAY